MISKWLEVDKTDYCLWIYSSCSYSKSAARSGGTTISFIVQNSLHRVAGWGVCILQLSWDCTQLWVKVLYYLNDVESMNKISWVNSDFHGPTAKFCKVVVNNWKPPSADSDYHMKAWVWDWRKIHSVKRYIFFFILTWKLKTNILKMSKKAANWEQTWLHMMTA